MHKNLTLRKLLHENYFADKAVLKKRDKFVSSAQEYVFDDGVFIGKNIERDNVRKGYGIMLYHDQSYY